MGTTGDGAPSPSPCPVELIWAGPASAHPTVALQGPYTPHSVSPGRYSDTWSTDQGGSEPSYSETSIQLLHPTNLVMVIIIIRSGGVFSVSPLAAEGGRAPSGACSAAVLHRRHILQVTACRLQPSHAPGNCCSLLQ